MFVALAEVLHFGRAAQRLGCTQPALSRGLQRLETDLDVQLFERDSRNVRLTTAGQAFLQGAIDILERASEASRVARTIGGSYVGRLVIGTGLCGQHSSVGRLVAAFRKLRPLVPVSLVGVDEPSVSRVLTDGSVHALVAIDWAFPAGCQVRPLFETELVVLLPSSSPLTEKESIRAKDLDGLQFVLPIRRQQPMIAEHFHEYCLKERIQPIVGIEAQTADQILGLVSGGATAALMPLPEGISYPGLVTRPLRPRYSLNYCLGWRKTSDLTEVLIEAMDTLS